MIEVLEKYEFEEQRGTTLIATRADRRRAALITPWNWPINQIACKVAPALAAGCTMVLKPTEVAPLNAILFAEILHDAGVPAGRLQPRERRRPDGRRGDRRAPRRRHGVVHRLDARRHRGGAQAAAPTVKRVAQELGGKSANIILDDADFAAAVAGGMMGCVDEQRPVVQRADAHARAGVAPRRGRGDREGDRGAGHGRRPVRGSGTRDRAGRERGAVRRRSRA